MRWVRAPRSRFVFWVSFAACAFFEAPAGAQNTPLQVCQRWTADRADLSEGTSTADIATCDAYDLSVRFLNALLLAIAVVAVAAAAELMFRRRAICR